MAQTSGGLAVKIFAGVVPPPWASGFRFEVAPKNHSNTEATGEAALPEFAAYFGLAAASGGFLCASTLEAGARSGSSAYARPRNPLEATQQHDCTDCVVT